MFYSEDVVEEIRTRNDIVDVISSYVPLKKKGSNYFKKMKIPCCNSRGGAVL